jgi:hypothetical protein
MVPLLTSHDPQDSPSGELDSLRQLACQLFASPEFDKGVWMKLVSWLIRHGYARKARVRNERTGFVLSLRAREMAMRLPITKILAILETEIRSDGGIPVACAPADEAFKMRTTSHAEPNEPILLEEGIAVMRQANGQDSQSVGEITPTLPHDDAEGGQSFPAIETQGQQGPTAPDAQVQVVSDQEMASYYRELQRLQQSIHQLETLRQSDPLPDPSELTIGGLARIVWDIEKLHEAAGASREAWDGKYTWDVSDRLVRRMNVMNKAPGFSEFLVYLNAEIGMPVIPEALKEVERRLARRLRQSFEDVRRLKLVEAVAILNAPEAGVHTPPPVPDGKSGSTIRGEPGPVERDAEPGGGRGPSLTPGAKAIAAAYDLKKEGRPVSLNAACRRAKVDRANLRERFPEAVAAIKALSAPDRTPQRGVMDRRAGNLDAIDGDGSRMPRPGMRRGTGGIDTIDDDDF